MRIHIMHHISLAKDHAFDMETYQIFNCDICQFKIHVDITEI